MKKVGKIKLNQFGQEELDRRKLNALKAGVDAPVVVVVVEEVLTGVTTTILEVVIHLITINRFFILKPEFFSVMNMNFGYKKCNQ